MNPEEKSRKNIDRLLKNADWTLQKYPDFNLSASTGIAISEFPLSNGTPDYLLIVNGKAIGVIEAKPEGTTLSGVSEQTLKYIQGIPQNVPHYQTPLPFAFESTGIETYFRDERDPDPCSRHIFTFHKPETLLEWGSQDTTLRNRLQKLPPLPQKGLWECQQEAIGNLEKSFKSNRPRALIQMATGSGKTFTAVNSVYRLIKFAKAQRILFLVDRNNLARQTKTEFSTFETPDDGRKFTELYNVQHLTTNTIDKVSKVCITTIQRLFSMLKGEEEFDPELEEESHFDELPLQDKPKEVVYNPNIPIETFDFIITDECHRSIYNLWRQVLEYFDAFIIGLTATPSKQTLGFFHQNLIMEYNHERAVADGVNVGYEIYRIQTEITEKGGHVDAGYYIDKRDKTTRKVRWELLEDDLDYQGPELDRSVVAKDQIRTVIKTFKEKLFTEIFPGRKEVPKTLVFTKNDSHAEDIVHIIKEEFGKGNEFCKKITYRTTGEKPENLIASFRNSYNPRIAVTVDMISTGTDIKPLECLLFMRDVKSRIYFDQMKGRGTRTISPTDFKGVTPDANYKTHFMIVDAVGVCETDKTDTQPLERKKSVSFEKLLKHIALGNRDEDSIRSLAGRLASINQTLEEKEKDKINTILQIKSLEDVINDLLDASDPDKSIEKAKELFRSENPTHEEIEKAKDDIAKQACKPFDDPELRNTLIEIKTRKEQIIDTVSQDKILYAGPAEISESVAKNTIDHFRKFIDENKNELTALQIIYEKPYGQRHLTYDSIKQLAEAIEKPPYSLTTDQIWKAYEQLEKSKIRGAGPQKLLTNIISLLRFAIGESEYLEPYSDIIDQKFEHWMREQEKVDHRFTPEQMEWLLMIKDHIMTSLSIEMDHFQYEPFYERGGAIKAYKLFGEELSSIMEELNNQLTA